MNNDEKASFYLNHEMNASSVKIIQNNYTNANNNNAFNGFNDNYLNNDDQSANNASILANRPLQNMVKYLKIFYVN